MKKSHLHYLDIFRQYDPLETAMQLKFSNLTHYSTFINGKANEIIILAAEDGSIDTLLLQKEINDLGRLYVKSFMMRKKEKL